MVRGSSYYYFPVTTVKKRDNSSRMITRLNEVTKTLKFPLPRVTDLQLKLNQNHRWFSVLDLKGAFLSLLLTERTQERTSLINLDGSYRRLRTIFGLKNASVRFCDLVAIVSEGWGESVFSYLDDFIVFSSSRRKHERYVRYLTQHFERRPVLQLEEILLGVRFLGHQVTNKGKASLNVNRDHTV